MIKIKILIVEDETIVALDIKNALKKLNFDVIGIVTNYHDALISVKHNKPDILLTDIHLKNSKSGIDIAQDIQKIASIPVIYLTAFSDEETIKEAIKTDPISYLIKPFNREELKSTILLAIYKINKSNQILGIIDRKKLGFGFNFDYNNKILYFYDQIIKLSNKEKELLYILIEADGQLVLFETLENIIWDSEPVSDSTLRTLLYRLRSKLDYKLIETKHSFGCKLHINTHL